MRRTGAFAILMVATILLAACGSAVRSGPVNLTVWTDPDTIGIGWWHTEIAAFQKLHPNIHVHVYQEAQSDDYAKYTTAITGHKAPDLMLTYSYPIVPTWAASGFIKPLGPYLQQLGFKSSSFFPYVNRLDTYDGKTVGLVQAYDDTFLTWNKQAFIRAGLNPNDPPHTLAQLWTDSQKLTVVRNGQLVQAGFVPFIGVGTLDVWDDLEGGDLYSSGRFHLDSPSMVHAMQLVTDYVKLLGGPSAWQNFYAKAIGTSEVNVGDPSAVSPESNANDPFYTGKLAMELVGDWYPIATYGVYDKNLDYGEAPPPVGPGVKYGTNPATGTDMFVVPTDSPHPLQATELALFLDQPGPALLWDRLESNMPPTAATIQSASFLKEVPTEWPSVLAAKDGLLIGYPTASAWSEVATQYMGPLEESLGLQRIGATSAAQQLQSDANQVVSKGG
jgi:multiple sugar transport system substrate-binding protein